MKDFIYSRFFKGLSGFVFIISLALAVLGGITLYTLNNTFSFSDADCDSYYETSYFNNTFKAEATSILQNIKELYDFSDYEDIDEDSAAITLFDYKTNNYISYSYSFLDENRYNLHIPYTFSMSYPSEGKSEITIVNTDESNDFIGTDYSVSSLTTINSEISETNSYYILSYSDYGNLIMKYGIQNQKSDGSLVSDEFSSDAYIYSKANYILVYSPNENEFFSSEVGWMGTTNDIALVFNSEQVSSYSTTEEGILLTPYEDYVTVVNNIVENYWSYKNTFNYLYNDIQNSSLLFYISGYGLPTSYSNISNHNIGVITPSYKNVIDNSSYYFYYNKTTDTLDSSLTFNFSDFSEYLPNANHASGIIAFGVPKDASSYNYSVFYKNEFLFEYALINYKPIIIITVISILLAILSFATLMSVTGRTKRDNKSITLYRFDNVFSEITIIPFFVSIFVFMLSCFNIFDCLDPSCSYSIYEFVIVTILLLICEFVILCTGLSLTRLIKTSKLIKQSFIYKSLLRLKKFIKMFIEGKSATFRTSLIFSIFSAILLVLVFFIAVSAANFKDIVSIFLIIIFFIVLIFAGAIQIYDAYGLAKITTAIKEIASGNLDYKVATANLNGQQVELAKNVNNIGAGLQKAIETSIKDERLKAELITNVSHDIKTPLTSIINYVDLLKRENIEDETILHYIDVLDQKSNRLKYLTEALVEASKVTTGNIDLNLVSLNFTELLNQTIGEFEDKFSEVNLTVVDSIATENTVIYADGQRTYRILENLFQNIYKYAMPGTRVYVDLTSNDDTLILSIKNISNHQLNISPDELTERFIRGDESRTTEGSGLGLSISKDLTALQNGTFTIQLDGDLFKTIITFKIYESPTEESV